LWKEKKYLYEKRCLRKFSEEETKEAIKMAGKFVSFVEKNLIFKK